MPAPHPDPLTDVIGADGRRTGPFLPPGVILAGGLARRMGGGDKGARMLAGHSLTAHVVARLAPQVAGLAINANGDPARFGTTGLPVLADPLPGHPGPLAGVLAAMIWAGARASPGVVTVAGDTPFLPRDLVARLARSWTGGIVMAASPNRAGAARDHPTVALWPVALAADLRAFLTQGGRRMRDWTGRHGAVRVVWPAEPVDPFFNINTPEDLAHAHAMLRARADL